MGQKLKTLVYT